MAWPEMRRACCRLLMSCAHMNKLLSNETVGTVAQQAHARDVRKRTRLMGGVISRQEYE